VARIGCLVLCIPILVVATPLILAFTLWNNYRAAALRREFLRRWPEKRGILVYSNSPNWQQYIEQHWLPRIGSQFVLLNWSNRSQWAVESPFEARVFRRFAGDREFNPLAIIFLPLGVPAPSTRNAAVIRFFQAFKDFRHGKDGLLHAREAELFSHCDDASGADGA
jgi:hypothetical protein